MLVMVWSETHCMVGVENSLKIFSEDIVQEIISFPRQALHAASLGFVHPKSNETLHFEALA